MDAADKIETQISNKVDEILKEFAGEQFASVDFSEFKERVKADYKEQLRFDNLPEAQYKSIKSAPSVIEEVFQDAMLFGASLPYHPFPKQGCPLCAYLQSSRR